jgi:hypothetical protein
MQCIAEYISLHSTKFNGAWRGDHLTGLCVFCVKHAHRPDEIMRALAAFLQVITTFSYTHNTVPVQEL